MINWVYKKLESTQFLVPSNPSGAAKEDKTRNENLPFKHMTSSIFGTDICTYIHSQAFEVGWFTIYEANYQLLRGYITTLEYCHLFAQPIVINH